jgi:hypothetical protein
MKKYYQILSFLLFSLNVQSQTLSPFVIPSCGTYFQNGGSSISSTIGETFTNTLSSSNNILSQGFQQPEVDVRTNSLFAGPYCNGDSLTIPFSATGIISTGNIFTAQLSDASGSFSSPSLLGSTTGNSSGIISGIVPYLTSAGSNYKLRVLASLPLRASNSQGDYQVNFCTISLHFKAYIQGFYAGAGQMTPVLMNTGLSTNPGLCDSVHVELHDVLSTSTIVASTTGVLHTDGYVDLQFPASVIGNSYYLVVHHRNSIETWSKDPVFVGSALMSFDFTE